VVKAVSFRSGDWTIDSLGRDAADLMVIGRALAEAQERGEVTPELTAAFNDRAVAFARNYELAVIALIIVLMVTKPF